MLDFSTLIYIVIVYLLIGVLLGAFFCSKIDIENEEEVIISTEIRDLWVKRWPIGLAILMSYSVSKYIFGQNFILLEEEPSDDRQGDLFHTKEDDDEQ